MTYYQPFTVIHTPYLVRCFPYVIFANYSITVGMRRKPYLLFFSALQALGYVLLALTVTGTTLTAVKLIVNVTFCCLGVIGAVLCLFVISFSSAFCSAIAEVSFWQKLRSEAHFKLFAEQALVVEVTEEMKDDPAGTVSDFTIAKVKASSCSF